MSYSKKHYWLSAALLLILGFTGIFDHVLAADDPSIEGSSSGIAFHNSSVPIALLEGAKPEKDVNFQDEEDIKNQKTHILFLCTGNSCRSQMAEGWARYLGNDIADIKSAGIKAHGLNPNAVKVMKESGVDITDQTSKVVTPDMIQWADLVVTVCGDADESCPLLPKRVKKVHWPLKDPAKAVGAEEEVIREFQTIRDEIRKHVAELLLGGL